MEHITLPTSVELILRRLKNAGYDAYVVGGCVRDSLMGTEPHDWDICTSARPEETIRLFDDCRIVPTGLKHGTVSVMINDILYEVTTFRTDGDYSDNRHPDTVSFVTDLAADLSRRDFTINAMAYCYDTGIVDLFGGVEDLTKKQVRCVGKPEDRFNEDALRILRTIRFALRFGFTIEENTMKAMVKLKTNILNISAERIRDETIKILSDVDYKKTNEDYFCLFMNMVYSYCGCTNSIVSIPRQLKVSSNMDLTSKLAALFDSYCVKHLRFPNRITNDVRDIHIYSRVILSDIGTWFNINTFKDNFREQQYYARRLLNRSSIDILIKAIALSPFAYRMEPAYAFALYVLQLQLLVCDMREDPVHVHDLLVDGNDLICLGFVGKEIGKALNDLLDLVMRDKVENKKEDLLRVAKRMKEEC